jgi:hypothetical protein
MQMLIAGTYVMLTFAWGSTWLLYSIK